MSPVYNMLHVSLSETNRWHHGQCVPVFNSLWLYLRPLMGSHTLWLLWPYLSVMISIFKSLKGGLTWTRVLQMISVPWNVIFFLAVQLQLCRIKWKQYMVVAWYKSNKIPALLRHSVLLKKRFQCQSRGNEMQKRILKCLHSSWGWNRAPVKYAKFKSNSKRLCKYHSSNNR